MAERSNLVDFEQVFGWCEEWDSNSAEGWLMLLINGDITLDEMRTSIHEDRPPKQRPTCDQCIEFTDDDGECGDCVNCKMPLCIHGPEHDHNHDGDECPKDPPS